MTTLSFEELQRRRAVCNLGLDPFPWYKQMRINDPVSVDEQDRLCELFRYTDVQLALNDPMLFSSKLEPDAEEGSRGSIAFTDPPRHKKLRSAVSQAFTPRTIVQQAENIRGIVNELLDASTTSGTLEAIGDLAVPLPIRVIASMLGVEPSQHADFKRWSDAVVGTSQKQAYSGILAIENAMRLLVIQRQKAPQADMITALIEAQVDGEPLSEQEILDFCVTLLVAGHETTTHQIGNTLLCLDQHPSTRSQVWDDPSLLPGAIEEALRFLPMTQRVPRRLTRNTQIGENPLKAGYRVLAWTASANRDEEQFPDPEVFDIRRNPNRHLTFGSGIHFCLGAPLARLEAKIALEQIIERFKDIERVREVPLQPITSYFGYGVKQLPLRLQKR